MENKRHTRRRSREIALQILYELDMRPDTDYNEAISLYPIREEDVKVAEYAKELLKGISEKSDEIADILRENIIGWRPDRMVAVDKAAITLALYEGILSEMVPVSVAISEAVELAKIFGTSDSGRFVNGVLGRIARSGNKTDNENND